MNRPVILMVQDDRAWLTQGEWSRSVSADEVTAWAAYSGVELRPAGGGSQLVMLDTDAQRRMFRLAWVATPGAGGAAPSELQ
jgi:hypothetical protein